MSDAHSLQEEDGFHEIQLNGKQLVFLGMTTTLVSVVIFLCGVLVGRGVKPIEPVAEAATTQTALAEPTPTPLAEPPAAQPAPAAIAPAVATPPAAEPPPAERDTPAPAPEAPAPKAEEPKPEPSKPEPKVQAAAKPADDLSYYDTLAKGSSKKSAKAGSTPAPVTKAPEPAKPTESEPATVAESTPTAVAAPAARSGGAIAVQVAALTSRSDAEAIARRLSGKGYAAYILSPEAGDKPVFKVRVGNYASADEAARVSRRLRQEEKLQPWVIR
jgi:DedD protein